MLIGLNSALPTAPLLAGGRLGGQQLARLEAILSSERESGRIRIVMLHHPVADRAVSARKALADRGDLRAVLRRQGAELVLHGHARDARLDAIESPDGPIPCVCVPSSSAVPNPRDEGARWHWLQLPSPGGPDLAEVRVRQWSVAEEAFIDAASYQLCLPRSASGSHKA